MAASATSKNGRNTLKSPNSALGHLFGESTRKSSLDANWNEVSPTVLLSIVWAVDALGGSVTIGSNKKGTAYFFKVYIGQAFDPVYFDGDEEGRAEMAAWSDRLMEAAAGAM